MLRRFLVSHDSGPTERWYESTKTPFKIRL
jgi:hypothetical protein